jgi:RNA polymerase sigma-70 factor, ECF subfamily
MCREYVTVTTESSDTERFERWFADLYRANHAAVLAYARRRVDDADDVVSEVFTSAWRARGSVPDPALTWLLRTASNHILHVYRSGARRQHLAARLEDRAETPSTHAASTGASPVIIAALNKLTAGDQELLRLSAWEELTISEIADVLECSPGTARVRLHRARARLAARLRELERGGVNRRSVVDPAATQEAIS